MVVNHKLFELFFGLLLQLGGSHCFGQWPQLGGMNRDFRVERADDPDQVSANEWSLELGLGDAPPIVAKQRIYVTESAYFDDGREAMRIRCLNLANGATLWQTLANEASFISQDISQTYPVRPLASPIAVGDKLIAVSFGGCVTCLRQETGQILWQHDLVSEFSATPIQYGWATSPWSNGKVVAIACGGSRAMVVAFDLDSGSLAWQSLPGEAAYGSFLEVAVDVGNKHLCYMGRDEIRGLDPLDGKCLWTYPLPNPERTNTVTPISLANGEFLVAGQGLDSCRRLRIHKVGDQWISKEIWKSRHFPFYCNWLVDPMTNQYVAFGSKVLGGVDLENGKVKWRERGWTDANFCLRGETLVGIRGDGFLALAKLTSESLELQVGKRVVIDRVWAPPVVVGQTVLIRGRRTLTAIGLQSLPAINEMPAGTEIDSMTAMYGHQDERVAGLLDKVKLDPNLLSFEDYLSVVRDRSIRFGEGEYVSLLNALKENDSTGLSLRIAKDWVAREPESIVAYERMLELVGEIDPSAVETLAKERMVNVEFDITVPDSTPTDARVFLSGNAMVLGNWKPDGLLLVRSADGHYRTTQRVPKGDLEFKLTQGSWDSIEVRMDGRGISNRRQRVSQPRLIQAQVQAWKTSEIP